MRASRAGPDVELVGFTLKVLHKDRSIPTETVQVSRAADVLASVETLLSKHPDCHRIHVEAVSSFLFSVDCNGDPAKD